VLSTQHRIAASKLVKDVVTRSSDPERDLDLVQRCLSADDQACRELFRRFEPQVRGVLFRVLGPDPDLEDLAQDAMVQLYRGFCRFRGDSSLRTWTDRVCVNAALQHLRKRSRRIQTVPMEGLDMPMTATDSNAEHQAERAALVGRIHQVMDRLTPDKRVAFLMHELEGRTAAEIATASDTPVSTIKSRIWYARQELHRAAAQDPVLRDYLDGQRRGGEK